MNYRPGIPRYLQIVDAIRQDLRGDGERIASEHALCERFKVSRPTIRQALDVLRREPEQRDRPGVDVRPTVLVERAEGELRGRGRGQLARVDERERRAEPLDERQRHRHTAPRDRADDEGRRQHRGQRVAERPPSLGAVTERHGSSA